MIGYGGCCVGMMNVVVWCVVLDPSFVSHAYIHTVLICSHHLLHAHTYIHVHTCNTVHTCQSRGFSLTDPDLNAQNRI